MNAPLEGSDFIRRLLKFAGTKLNINYSTSAAGQLPVEIQDSDGLAFPGFSLDECDPIYGDHIDRTVRWKDESDVSVFSGKPIRLRFEMSDADL